MVNCLAFSGELPGYGERREVLGAALDPDERARILAQIAYRGIDFVAKEAVTLSTTPVWRNGKAASRGRSRSGEDQMTGGRSCPADRPGRR